MSTKYRQYFDIDPEYFPQVNEAEIESHPDLWKKFYPHETFVRLLKDAIRVLSRKQNLSLWVEGAYGTGKSHAVLTLKKLLDASEEETHSYFQKYPDQLDEDLYNKFQQVKSGGKILTVHRYGSSDIRGDSDLVFAIQQSIVTAMQEAGIDDHGEGALKDAAVRWLSDSYNKTYFNGLLAGPYQALFGGDTVDDVIAKLEQYSAQAGTHPSEGKALQTLMGKIMRVSRERQITALKMDTAALVAWIQSVIERNHLKAIFFVWDEFTEYFRNNLRALTGFQEIVDFSGAQPFYLLIVTHNVAHIFPSGDKECKKIQDRFVQPICNIELPENMAFRLMGSAMTETQDPALREEWEEGREDLWDRTQGVREIIKKKARISDEELKHILPIHPFAALLLQHISTAFDSNQRSMFDFIKNDRGDEIKGFQWFIDNFGMMDSGNPFLTIDMLWDFFYEKGKEYLSTDIRTILDTYAFSDGKSLTHEEQRVLKTVLLLQAISMKTGDTVELFRPNERNLSAAFEGTDLDNGAPVPLADRLVRQNILYKKPLPNNQFQYAVLVNSGNTVELEKQKKIALQKKTSALLPTDTTPAEILQLSGFLELRYQVEHVTQDDFRSKVNRLRQPSPSMVYKIPAVVAFAKNDAESAAIGRDIQHNLAEAEDGVVYIDASVTPLGADALNQYAEAVANAFVNQKQDRSMARQYETIAEDVLKKWMDRVRGGEFIVYSKENPSGERCIGLQQLWDALEEIDRKRYPNGLEHMGSVTNPMWQSSALAKGVECGALERPQSQFRSSNEKTKLETFIGADAWQVPGYWKKKPGLPISKLKISLDQFMTERLTKRSRVSSSEIYEFFADPHGAYGFMPCNLTAFIFGFLLKEYADGSYTWSDNRNNVTLDVAKLKEMISGAMKHASTPNLRYVETYLVATTAEEKAFQSASSKIFALPLEQCVSVERTREYIRQKMKGLDFPIWTLEYALKEKQLAADPDDLAKLIRYYVGIANNKNLSEGLTENDIAIRIGRLAAKKPEAVEALATLMTKDMCVVGMEAYLKEYADGVLPALAAEVGDHGQYINYLKKKFDADAAQWAWNQETADQKIDEEILEYQIIVESNKFRPKTLSFSAALREWQDACRQIRISYRYAANYWGNLSSLMELLYQMSKQGSLAESQRKKFLDEISTYGEVFQGFYTDQVSLFKSVCSYILERFSDEEIHEIFHQMKGDLFIMEKSEYQKKVEAVVNHYVNEQGMAKLKQFWRELTQTEDPYAWSRQYQMPILCMVDESQVSEARRAFDTIHRSHPEKKDVDHALAFLQQATFYDRLKSKEERDQAFQKGIVKTYSVLLTDTDQVKAYLSSTIREEPYEWWFAMPAIGAKLEKMAENAYNGGGYQKAMEKIEQMDVADVKYYLERLIENNMVVGMEIIKGK